MQSSSETGPSQGPSSRADTWAGSLGLSAGAYLSTEPTGCKELHGSWVQGSPFPSRTHKLVGTKVDSLFWGPLIIPGLLWKENPDTRGSFWECWRESRKDISCSDIGFLDIGLFIPWTLVG